MRFFGLASVLLVGCGGSDAHESASTNRRCDLQWGPIGLPWAEGTFATHKYGDSPIGPYLAVDPDSVEATTSDGRTISCDHDLSGYDCRDDSGRLKTIRVTLDGQRWSWPAECPYYEDPTRLSLDGAKPCVAAGTTVVEGDLLQFDSSRPQAIVTLEGPWQIFAASTHGPGDDGHVPGVRCAVRDGHYACPTLGFRESVTHTVVAGGVRTEVMLPVQDCKVSSIHLDVTCPAAPAGLFIASPDPWWDSQPGRPRFIVSASYEGLPSYACGPATEPVYVRSDEFFYFCPAAPSDALGVGRYEIVAVDKQDAKRIYTGSAIDAFDGCGGGLETVSLTAVEPQP